MEFVTKKNAVEFVPCDDFDLRKTFECGQCFRWNEDDDGSYTGVAFGLAARIRSENGCISVSGTAENFMNVWKNYFDLDRRYSELRKNLCIDEYMQKATEFGAGIRILRQEPWEALCSFIISQCNNIPRIKGIIEKLCDMFGDPVPFEGGLRRAFPSAERLAPLTEADLEPLRCGYRAEYIINAARAVADGSLNLEELSLADSGTALQRLKELSGVGDKVASCVVLFGLGMIDAFPRDVWIKRAVAEQYGADFDESVFGGLAGLAQQYMFYHRRSGG